MEIPEYRGSTSDSNYLQAYDFMPGNTFRMLISGPSGCGKTNTLLHMLLAPLVMYDKIYLYSHNLDQSAYQKLYSELEGLSNEVGYPILETYDTAADILPLDQLNPETQNIAIFDDMLCERNQRDISEYFIGGRHRNCSCIYLSQSFFDTKKQIRLNCSHHIIFEHPTRRESRSICSELGIPEHRFRKATEKPYSFAYVDKVKKKVFRNFFGEL